MFASAQRFLSGMLSFKSKFQVNFNHTCTLLSISEIVQIICVSNELFDVIMYIIPDVDLSVSKRKHA